MNTMPASRNSVNPLDHSDHASGSTGLTRRTLLGAAMLLPLTGCATGNQPPISATSPTPPSSPTTTMSTNDHFAQLERKYDARLGVYGLATDTGATITYCADERFAFCSTFKTLAAAAVLAHNPLTYLDTVIHYTRDDIRSISPITPHHVDTGMAIGQLCDAAIRHSDGTAGNLLMNAIGGPAQLTAYLRSLGDTVSRMDQFEPELNRDAPGDDRDTTTAAAIAGDYRRLVLGETLSADKRAALTDWLLRNTTGAERIRAGIPKEWKVADKTGTGDYGRANDVAIIWPPASAPLVVAIMSDRTGYDAEPRSTLIAEATTALISTLT